MTENRLAPRSRLLTVAASVASVLLVGGTLAAVAVEAEPFGVLGDEGVPPVVVSVRPARGLAAYEVERRFVGVVEARRESAVGFELGGELLEIAADEGDFVEAGAILARLDTQLLEAERATRLAAVEEARVALELADLTRGRVRAALDRNAVAQQAWDDADKGRDAAAAALSRAEASLTVVEARIRRATLVAPFPALVAERFADEGRVVAAGTPVLHLLERVEPEVRIGVAGPSIDAVAVGDAFELAVRDRHVPATVRAILPVRGNGTRTVDVVLTLHTQFDGIRRGDLATLTLMRSEEEAGFWLPLSALTESSRGLWAVYVAEPLDEVERAGSATHHLRRRELELLHEDGPRVYARGTLRDGDLFVVEGLQRLIPDLRVRLAGDDALTSIGAL